MAFDGSKFAMALGENLLSKSGKKLGTGFADYLKKRKKKNQFGVEELDKGANPDKIGDMPNTKPESAKSLIDDEEDKLNKKYKYIS